MDRYIFSMKSGFLLVLALLTAGFGGVERVFAPEAELWPRWTAADDVSRTTVDHGDWDRFLQRYIKTDDAGHSRIAYGQVAVADQQMLDAYIERLRISPVDRLRKAEQLAYWINLYNALTVKLILTHYPVESIRDISISPGFFSIGPWDRKLIEIAGELISLNDIEHRILRPIWRDPRLHYALNCAALGCPNLQSHAFTADNTDAVLTAAARAYVNHPRGSRLDGEQLVVSSIYDWFIVDFGGDEAGIIEHLRQYAEPALKAILDDPGSLESAYDWALNDARE